MTYQSYVARSLRSDCLWPQLTPCSITLPFRLTAPLSASAFHASRIVDRSLPPAPSTQDVATAGQSEAMNKKGAQDQQQTNKVRTPCGNMPKAIRTRCADNIPGQPGRPATPPDRGGQPPCEQPVKDRNVGAQNPSKYATGLTQHTESPSASSAALPNVQPKDEHDNTPEANSSAATSAHVVARGELHCSLFGNFCLRSLHLTNPKTERENKNHR